MYKSYDELPVMLSVHDVAEVLGISKSSAYVFLVFCIFRLLSLGRCAGII